MIRDIFVPILRSGSDEAALDAAMALGLAHQAHVAALVTIESPMPMATEYGYVPVEVNQRMLDEARAAAHLLAKKTREHLARTTITSEVRVSETMLLWSEETAALQARHADLTVMGGYDTQLSGSRFALTFKALLLQSGRPVLMVPAGAILQPEPERVVLAWQPTREATRSLHDALPLLSSKAAIDVLMIDPDVTEASHGEQPGADIAKHLARHGFTVRVVSQPRQNRSDGENILAYVLDIGADLLVMGGYGHSKWREALLGGTTRTVMQNTHVPVLFAH